ncbi:MAG: HypC/HybG/HupF family hydrogenase formation chaperone [Phycisphaerae bacterium]|nr:HypC/HybG/HupF family hydrogenase formation chaperone [Phycisphaerae bacterium]
MCLAVPGRIIESEDDGALVDLQGNRLRISKVLTPEACVGDWVLVHAGFAISMIDENDALETWSYLRQCYGTDIGEAAGIEGGGQ